MSAELLLKNLDQSKNSIMLAKEISVVSSTQKLTINRTPVT